MSFLDSPAYLPVTCPVTGGSTNRSAELTSRILDMHDLLHPRYQRDSGGLPGTRCNIFVWDVSRAHGCEIAHVDLFRSQNDVAFLTWLRGDGADLAGQISEPFEDEAKHAAEALRLPRWRELDANAMVLWLLGDKGKSHGWREVTEPVAIDSAAAGLPTVAAWHNPAGIGHIAWVIPTPGGESGVWLAQAGATNARRVRAVEVFPRSAVVRYASHD